MFIRQPLILLIKCWQLIPPKELQVLFPFFYVSAAWWSNMQFHFEQWWYLKLTYGINFGKFSFLFCLNIGSWRSTSPSIPWKTAWCSWWTNLHGAIFIWFWATTIGWRANKRDDLQGSISTQSWVCLKQKNSRTWSRLRRKNNNSFSIFLITLSSVLTITKGSSWMKIQPCCRSNSLGNLFNLCD